MPGFALDEVLADQRLRPRLAERVGAELAKAGLLDLHRDQRVALARIALDAAVLEVYRGDLSRLHPRDLEVRAVDEPEGVVDRDLVGRVARSIGGAQREEENRA